MKKPAKEEEIPRGYFENFKYRLKGDYRVKFVSLYYGIAILILFLFLVSLAPQIGERLGLISQKKQSQQSLAKEKDESPGQPKQKITPGVKAVSPQLIEKQKISESKESPVSEEKTPAKVTADLNGKVVDAQSGLPVAGAQVIIESEDFNSKATTDESGNYQILDIPAGEYEVEVEKDGFSGQVKPAILASGSTVSIDFSLSK